MLCQPMQPMLFEASSPTMPALPDLPVDLSNLTARFASSVTDLTNDISNGTQRAVEAELQKELAVLKSFAAPLDEGLATGLAGLVAGFGGDAETTTAKESTTATTPKPDKEPQPFSLPSLFGF